MTAGRTPSRDILGLRKTMALTVSERCFGKFRLNKLTGIRRVDGSPARLRLPPMRTPFGAQPGQHEHRRYLDFPLEDPTVAQAMRDLDGWAAAAALEAWPQCVYVPVVKPRQHLAPKLRLCFSAVGPYRLRCWSPQHQAKPLEDVNFKTSLLTPLVFVRGLWSDNGTCGLLLEMVDLAVDARECLFVEAPARE